MEDFTGQTVIVTGGGKGIGRGIAASFAKAGAQIAICGRSAPDPFEPELADRIHFLELDVREADNAARLVDFAAGLGQPVTTLINNAGGSPPVASAQASASLTEKIVRLNLLAPIFLSQAVYNHMRSRNVNGSIINISSVSATRSSPGTVAYGAAKAGLLNVTKSLAMEWAPDVRVNAIVVGLVRTESSGSHYGGEKGMAYLADNLPMKRMGRPEDIAHACLFLADPAASYVSGACLEVSGGGEPPSFLRIIQEAPSQDS